MDILNLGGTAEGNAPATKSRKKFRVLLGIGALAAVTGIGSTLAANISLNGGGNVEFGQGVATTAACDDQITISPISTFDNAEDVNYHIFSSISLSEIDSSSDNCDGKDFIIKAYSNSGILNMFESSAVSYTSVRVYDDGGYFSIVSDDNLDLEITSANNSQITNTSFSLTFSSPLASADDVKRITIESVNHVDTGLISFGGHLYQLVQTPLTWSQAYLDITTPVNGQCKYQLNGKCGYFATITSNEERSAVIGSIGNGALWLGGSDIENEGIWNWIDGPEYGLLISSFYENWNDGEPNNSGEEDALQTLAGTGGQWNDLSVFEGSLPYLVEYSSGFNARTHYLP